MLECATGLDCKNGRCIDAGSKKLGEHCCRDDQCATGSCNKNNQCQCKKDEDCGGTGRFCDTGGWAGIGMSCRDAQCTTGSCNDVGQCQCTKDEQCRARTRSARKGSSASGATSAGSGGRTLVRSCPICQGQG